MEVVTILARVGTTHQIMMYSQVGIPNSEKSLMKACFTSSTWASLKRMAGQRNENIKGRKKTLSSLKKRGDGLQMCLRLGNAIASLWKSESKDWRKRRRAPSQPQFFLRSSPLATKIASLPIKMQSSEKSRQLAQKVIIQVVFLVEWNKGRGWNFHVKYKYPFYSMTPFWFFIWQVYLSLTNVLIS